MFSFNIKAPVVEKLEDLGIKNGQFFCSHLDWKTLAEGKTIIFNCSKMLCLQDFVLFMLQSWDPVL